MSCSHSVATVHFVESREPTGETRTYYDTEWNREVTESVHHTVHRPVTCCVLCDATV